MAVNKISKTGTGSSSIYAADYFQTPFNIGIQAVLTGTATFSVEYTLDDITDASVTPTWTAITGLSAVSASTNGQLTIPCRGIRLTIASGTGGVVATICQAGIG